RTTRFSDFMVSSLPPRTRFTVIVLRFITFSSFWQFDSPQIHPLQGGDFHPRLHDMVAMFALSDGAQAMFFNSNDYSLDKEYRNRQMQTVGRPEQVATLPAPRLSFVSPIHRTILYTIFFIFVATMMFGSNAVGATDDMRRANADPSSSTSVQSALILGDF